MSVIKENKTNKLEYFLYGFAVALMCIAPTYVYFNNQPTELTESTNDIGFSEQTYRFYTNDAVDVKVRVECKERYSPQINELWEEISSHSALWVYENYRDSINISGIKIIRFEFDARFNSILEARLEEKNKMLEAEQEIIRTKRIRDSLIKIENNK